MPLSLARKRGLKDLFEQLRGMRPAVLGLHEAPFGKTLIRKLWGDLSAAKVIRHHVDPISPPGHGLGQALESNRRAPRCRERAGGDQRNVQRRQRSCFAQR